MLPIVGSIIDRVLENLARVDWDRLMVKTCMSDHPVPFSEVLRSEVLMLGDPLSLAHHWNLNITLRPIFSLSILGNLKQGSF